MMLHFSGAVLAAVLLSVVEISGIQGAKCDAKYAKLTPNHTMCLTDSRHAVEVRLTQDVKNAIVDRHNEIRKGVNPASSDMMKMTWDDRLAKVATKWVMQCVSEHDMPGNRAEPDLPGFVGQNLAGSQSSFLKAVNAWHSEKNEWRYGVRNTASGQYAQQIYSKAYLIGCGQARCNGRNVYACNYFSGLVSSKPYKRGIPCTRCPKTCDSQRKLCECKAAPVCFNGGSLNISTCKCDCPRLWTGDNCTTMACPRQDFKDKCKRVTTCDDKKKKICPIKCGICPKPCGDKECKHNGTLNTVDCSCTCKKGYSGDTCECKAAPVCFNGGSFNISICKCDCPRLWTGDNCTTMACPRQDFKDKCKRVTTCDDKKKKICPIKCGICPKPCGDKECKHNGTLNTVDCSCTCKNGYSGDTCECKAAPVCFNGGSLNISTCKCDCPRLWTGDNCTTMACPRQDFKDKCKRVTTCDDKKKKICPIKCGICPKPCGDKECKHNGTLNTVDCSCTCKKGYSGDTCEVSPKKHRFNWRRCLGSS